MTRRARRTPLARRELAAAGITGAELQEAFLTCRALNARHGKTYFLSTLLLPPERRPAVHALYGFARYVDDVVDNPGGDPRAELDRIEAAWATGAPGRHRTERAIFRAVRATAARYGIDPALFEAFLASMRMDLTVSGYETHADLGRYTYGSAAVIGLQLLPVLGSSRDTGTLPRPARAEPYAADLGVAFQLTNFLRDVAEDLRRGRVYLPTESLDRFGVRRADLDACRGLGVSPPVRALIESEVARTRTIYARAEPGIGLLDPASRDCVRTAFMLYGGILDEIEGQRYDVFAGRAQVPLPRRLAVALPALRRARRARRIQPARSARRIGWSAVDAPSPPHPPGERLQHQREPEQHVLDGRVHDAPVPEERRP